MHLDGDSSETLRTMPGPLRARGSATIERHHDYLTVVTVGPALTDVVPTEHPGGYETFGPGCRILHAFQVEGDGFHPAPAVRPSSTSSSISFVASMAYSSFDPQLRAMAYPVADVFLFGFPATCEGEDAAAATRLLQEVIPQGKPIVALRVGATKAPPPTTPSGVGFQQQLASVAWNPGEPCIFGWDFEHTDGTSSAQHFRDENARCAFATRSAWLATLAMCEEAYLDSKAKSRRRQGKMCTLV